MSDNNEFRDNSNRGGRPSGNKPSGGSGRGGYQKDRSYGDRKNGGRSGGFDKKPYRKDGDRKFNREDSEKKFDRGDRPRRFDDDKKFDKGDRPRRFDDDKKFDRGDRPRRFDNEKKFDREDRPRRFDDEKKSDRPYGDRKGGGRSFDRNNGDHKPFRKDGERKPYREDGDRKPYRDGEKRDFADKRRDGGEGGRKFERRDNERSFERRDFGGKSEGRGGVGRDRKFDHYDGERRPPRREDSKGFDRKDGDRGFDRNRNERKFEDGEKRFERRESSAPRDGERRGGDPKFASTPKDQARKGYQGRKGRADGHCASPARQAALTVVSQLRRRDAFAQDLISKYIDRSTMSPEDRAFATRLVLGVVTTRGTLDDILNRCMNSPEDVSPEVRDALHISAYEIMFLDKEAHAAVDQGVELVRSVAPKASGVGNAVLRKLVTIKDQFPFGDPQRELSAYARQHAFPEWLAKELVETFGPDGAHAFMEACNDPAPVFVGINAAKEGEEEVYQTLVSAKGEPESATVDGRVIPGCFKINSGQLLTDGRIKRLINNGNMLVSDLASQAVADLVLPEQKPASMLEIGAGRATKTVLVQSNSVRRWGSQIEEYITLDNHEFKTKLLQERAEQYGINVTEAVTGDATDLDASLEGRMFDVIFIDAPCTGLGTLRRHPEIRWRLKPETIDEYSELGLAMLKQAASHVNPGGTLVYATCTVTRKENSGVIKAFLESSEGAGFRLVPVEGKAAFVSELTPGGSDAHFAAKMVKVAE